MSWEMVKLGDVCEIQIGRTPSRSNSDYWGEGRNWVSIADLSKSQKYLTRTKERITQKAISECNCKEIPKDTVLLSFKLSIGKVAITQFPLYTNEAIAGLIIKNSEELCFKYLYYVLQHIDYLEYTDKAVKGKTLNLKKLSIIQIPLPPLPEQQRIAALLEQVDHLRHLRQRALQRLDDLVQSTFLEMFGTEINKNSNDYTVSSLGKLTSKITDGTHQSPTFLDSGIPFILVSNIKNGQISLNTKKYISETEYLDLTKNTPIEKGDILYTTVGSYGNAALVDFSSRFCFQRHIAQIKPNPECINTHYLVAFLQSLLAKRQADKLAIGVAQKTLNLKSLRSFEIIVPSREKQEKIVGMSQAIEQEKKKHQSSLNQLDTLFNALMQQAFTGQLQWKSAEDAVAQAHEQLKLPLEV